MMTSRLKNKSYWTVWVCIKSVAKVNNSHVSCFLKRPAEFKSLKSVTLRPFIYLCTSAAEEQPTKPWGSLGCKRKLCPFTAVTFFPSRQFSSFLSHLSLFFKGSPPTTKTWNMLPAEDHAQPPLRVYVYHLQQSICWYSQEPHSRSHCYLLWTSIQQHQGDCCRREKLKQFTVLCQNLTVFVYKCCMLYLLDFMCYVWSSCVDFHIVCVCVMKKTEKEVAGQGSL